MHFVRLAIACIVLGFVTSVAVAWGLAAWLPQRDWSAASLSVPHRVGMITGTEYMTTGAVRRTWNTLYIQQTWYGSLFDDAIYNGQDDSPIGAPRRREFSGPTWGIAPEKLKSTAAPVAAGCDHATGWPFLTAWYEISEGKGGYVIQYGIALPRAGATRGVGNAIGRNTPPWRIRALPLQPIWRGVVLNTMFYGVVWVMLIAAGAAVRRWRRRRCRLCARCAYDLVGLPPGELCPECGAASGIRTNAGVGTPQRGRAMWPGPHVGRFVCMCILLGFLTTVGVTWGLAAALPQRDWNSKPIMPWRRNGGLIVKIEEYRTRAALRRTWHIDDYSTSGQPPPRAPAIDNEPELKRRPVEYGEPHDIGWGKLADVLSNPSAFATDECEHATGWPLLAGWYTIAESGPPNVSSHVVEGGIPLYRNHATMALARIRALPCRPIWGGVLINTLFYSAAWVALAGCTHLGRVAMRRRRGVCTACAYDRTGLTPSQPCPECGFACPSRLSRRRRARK